jgi:formylglycine-generating enzyme required for sulfatase activity
VAADGTGSNGLYTSQLLRFIDSPDLPVETMLKRVSAAVTTESKKQQEPWTEGSIVGEFYFKPGAVTTTAKPEPVTSDAQVEQQGWAAAQAGNTDAGYAAYLREYPQGRFAAAARIARASLQTQVAVVQPPPPIAPVVPISATTSTAGQMIKDCADCPEMVVIPVGSFRMGSPDSEKDRWLDGREGPVHEVRIGYSFAMGKHELTRGEFSRFAVTSGYKTEAERTNGCAAWDGKTWTYDASKNWRNPGFAQTDRHPVVCLSWNDAQAYLAWLNEKSPGKGFRLPSEAEWEYAARAGQGATRYPWGDDLSYRQICGFANGMDTTGKAQVPGVTWTAASCGDGHAYTAPAGSFKVNAFGLHDMHGNAWEWVQDVWHDNYQGAPDDGSAWLTGGYQARRVLRGGAWYISPGDLRSANSSRLAPDFRDTGTGMRIARTL